jgi:hypothetical protein
MCLELPWEYNHHKSDVNRYVTSTNLLYYIFNMRWIQKSH